MARKGFCCVADQFCEAASNFEERGYVSECFVCGEDVCVKCSSRRQYMPDIPPVRMCNDCQVRLDGNDKIVMARLNKLANLT
jgi:hypothetical protein